MNSIWHWVHQKGDFPRRVWPIQMSPFKKGWGLLRFEDFPNGIEQAVSSIAARNWIPPPTNDLGREPRAANETTIPIKTLLAVLNQSWNSLICFSTRENAEWHFSQNIDFFQRIRFFPHYFSLLFFLFFFIHFLMFIISFLLLILGLFCCSFLVIWSGNLDYWFESFLVF